MHCTWSIKAVMLHDARSSDWLPAKTLAWEKCSGYFARVPGPRGLLNVTEFQSIIPPLAEQPKILDPVALTLCDQYILKYRIEDARIGKSKLTICISIHDSFAGQKPLALLSL